MKIKERIKPYIMIAPAMTGIFIFTVYPIYRLFVLSFLNVNLLNPARTRFVGWENYQRIFSLDAFSKSITNTAIYSFAMIILVMTISLMLAVWLGSKKSFYNSFVQLCVYTPHIVSMVSVAIIWQWLMNSNHGFFNYILRSLGMPPSKFLESSSTALASVITVAAWKSLGYYTLIFIAALQGIPQEIYEAAALDKSNRVTTFFKITLPMITPQIFFVLIILTIGSFKTFETIRILTSGGPNNATISIVYLIYREAFNNFRVGSGAAVGVVLLFIVSILIIFYFRSLSKRVHYQ